MVSLSLLQGIFPSKESNQGLLHCRWILCLNEEDTEKSEGVQTLGKITQFLTHKHGAMAHSQPLISAG